MDEEDVTTLNPSSEGNYATEVTTVIPDVTETDITTTVISDVTSTDITDISEAVTNLLTEVTTDIYLDKVTTSTESEVTDILLTTFTNYWSNLTTTEITTDYFNNTETTEDYLNSTELPDTEESCEYIPWIISTTFEDFETTFEPFFLSSSLYNVIPAELIVFLLIIGILGNLINIFVYTRPIMSSSISKLLAILELVNLFVFFTFFSGLIRHYNPKWQLTFSHVILELIDIVVENAVICFSNWLTVLVGLWRYVAIKWPLNVERFCGWSRTRMIVLIIAALSILISIPPAFLKTYEKIELNLTYNSNSTEEYSGVMEIYKIMDTQLSCLNPDLEKFSDGLVLLSTVIPCLCLAIVTGLLLHSLWNANAKRRVLTGSRPLRPGLRPQYSIPFNRNESARETRVTILLTLLVFLYFLAYLPDTIINVKQLTPDGTDSLHETTFYDVFKTRISIILCNSATFFIYLIMSERYRETLRKHLLPAKMTKDFTKTSSTLHPSLNSSKTVSLKDLTITPV